MNQILKTNRNIDIVFCIDGTGSMTPCLESVKRNALHFQTLFAEEMTKRNTDIDSMRVKVIVFIDYHDDKEEAMQMSRFYELPTDMEEFKSLMDSIVAGGGGDSPENGLEALYFAMKSDFTTGPKDRQIIVLFSDADALPLLERKEEFVYPMDMVDEEGLTNLWACITQDSSIKLRDKNKRLLLFAPDDSKYKELASKFERCIFEPVNMAEGLGDIDFSDIISLIAASASSK